MVGRAIVQAVYGHLNDGIQIKTGLERARSLSTLCLTASRPRSSLSGLGFRFDGWGMDTVGRVGYRVYNKGLMVWSHGELMGRRDMVCGDDF
jgi:hypothetical protein